MTTRIQIIRSSTPGAVPAAGTRSPGELWTTFPDLQLGVIDASKNAQKLIGVRFFSTTANYAVGDFVIQAGVLYVAKVAVTAGAFNATQWTQIAAATDAGGPYLSVAAGASTYLPLAGGTMTGFVTLSGAPSSPLHASTKAYADTMLPLAGGTMTGLVTLSGPPSNPQHAATKAYVDAGAFVPVAGGANTGLNDNRIINGDMRIDQRNNGASGTVNGTYTVDRWQYVGTQAAKGTWGRNLNGWMRVDFPYVWGFQSSSAYASLTTDEFIFYQPIEADMISDFQWGTATAQSVTLSFWAASTLTGTFSGVIKNGAGTRSYPFTYSLPVSNTWYKIVITIPGDTAGTWVMSGNAASLAVCFDLGTGSTHRGPANVWAATNYDGVTGAVSIVGTNGAQFYVTGVKLEIGSIATPYNRQSLAKSMVDCQRYYQGGPGSSGSYFNLATYNLASQFVTISQQFRTIMRATPTIVITPSGMTNITNPTVTAVTGADYYVSGTATATGQVSYYGNFSASAEL
jgi:hypothetical protein